MPRQLHFQIDAHSGIPVYRQMVDQVKYYVAAGTLAAGDQLPSIRELAERLTVNPTTVVKAYNELVHEGVIELRHGRGAFVAEAARQNTSSAECEKALRRHARQLAIEAGQMGAEASMVLRLVEEELEQLHADQVRPTVPLKVASARR
jgi:GntR family transcriptional regulator